MSFSIPIADFARSLPLLEKMHGRYVHHLTLGEMSPGRWGVYASSLSELFQIVRDFENPFLKLEGKETCLIRQFSPADHAVFVRELAPAVVLASDSSPFLADLFVPCDCGASTVHQPFPRPGWSLGSCEQQLLQLWHARFGACALVHQVTVSVPTFESCRVAHVQSPSLEELRKQSKQLFWFPTGVAVHRRSSITIYWRCEGRSEKA